MFCCVCVLVLLFVCLVVLTCFLWLLFVLSYVFVIVFRMFVSYAMCVVDCDINFLQIDVVMRCLLQMVEALDRPKWRMWLPLRKRYASMGQMPRPGLLR